MNAGFPYCDWAKLAHGLREKKIGSKILSRCTKYPIIKQRAMFHFLFSISFQTKKLHKLVKWRSGTDTCPLLQ
jgi:hypothetical protein